MRRCESTGDDQSWYGVIVRATLAVTCHGWIALIVILLPILTPELEAADHSYSLGAVTPLWSADLVRQCAVDHSPTARMLESERRAAGTGIKHDDPKQCAQVRLKRCVMADLARHERNRAAADVLEVYYRIVGLARQRQLLVEATAVIDHLIGMADEAESLGLSQEDPNDLRRKRLVTDDKLLQLDGGVAKLRLQLAQLSGQPIECAEQAILITPLMIGHSIPHVEDAIALALSQRADLRALQRMAECLDADTLPATRDLLAAQNPGLGMVTQAARRLALPCLSGPDVSDEELRLRRQQCHQLAQARADQIELEVRGGLVDVSTARGRGNLAQQRSQLALSSIEQRRASIELDRAAPGSDQWVKLEMLTAEGDYTQNQIDEAVAWVRLHQAQGIAAELQ